MSDQKQKYRDRILGSSAAPVSVAASWAWVEVATPAYIPPPPPPVAVPEFDEDNPNARYYREDFVRGKIENWSGRPAGDGNRHPLVVSDEQAVRMELRRGSVMPVDHTDADVTARTFVAMDEREARVLQWFHTSTMKLGEIAYEVGVSYTECRRLIEQGHVTFCEIWENQDHKLRDELRRLRPDVDPSRDAVPLVAQPRPAPAVAPCVTTREPAPVLGYRETQTRVGESD